MRLAAASHPDPPARSTNLYSSCLVCARPFPPNRVLEHLPGGDRVAYDLHRGRLWQICRSCRRWILIPMEARWEALEELEGLLSGGSGRRSRGSPEIRLVARTDHVSLFNAGPLEIIRVGEAGLAEEALWRYGRLQTRGRFPDGGFLGPFSGRLSRRRLGRVAWRGQRACPGCGHVFTELPFTDRKILILKPVQSDGDAKAPLSVSRRCPRCRDADQGGFHLRGVEADFVLARVMAFEHPTGASRDRVRAAVNIMEDVGGASVLLRLLTKHGRPLGDLPAIGSMALEIHGNEAKERALLKLEVDVLEARWRKEEELAALMDGELTSVPGLESLVRRIRG